MSASISGGAHPPDYRGEIPSDYKGKSEQQCSRENTVKSTNENVQSRNYATVTEGMPDREYAIVLHTVEGFSLRDHVKEILKFTDPINIKYICKISNGRICIYLSSKQIADKLLEKSKKINLNNNEIIISPLVSRAKRIILSNVYPEIPNSLIEDQLKEHKIRLESKIIHIKAGMADLGLLHTCSFRRQVYIHPTTVI